MHRIHSIRTAVGAGARRRAAFRRYEGVFYSAKAPSGKILEGNVRVEELKNMSKSGWRESDGRDAIEKEFVFENFVNAWSFMSGVAVYAEKVDHHPEWFNVYNKVNVLLSTHDAGGISMKDIDLAMYMDEAARKALS